MDYQNNTTLLSSIIGEQDASYLLSTTNYSLVGLAALNAEQLMAINGIGRATANKVVSLFELSKRKDKELIPRIKISSSKDAYDAIKPHLSDLDKEKFVTLYMRNDNSIISIETISLGTCSATVVDIKHVIRRALELRCKGLIVSHNHPSGNLNPSPHDIRVTKKLQTACEFMDLDLRDHIIIGQNEFHSFADHSEL
jgi:DNA repair protein RadC